MSDEQQTPPMATPRVAAGALFFDEDDRTLLVKPTYKDGWDIPGGYVEPGETPKQACRREIMEELGLEPQLGRLLVVDWAPNPGEGDKLLFVFSGGVLSFEQREAIRLDKTELEECEMCHSSAVEARLISRLAKRVLAATIARNADDTVYLEDGIVVD